MEIIYCTDLQQSAAISGNGHAEKLALALEWMGKRHVLHPSNRVKRLAEPLPEVFTWKPKVLRGKK